MELSVRQARRFLLLKHGLIGAYRFRGKKGALEYVRQAGCIQFDPVDVCGKNAELTLQSRVRGFTRRALWELLYQDRLLVDYPDKNLSIFPAEDWPYFERYRRAAREQGRGFEGLEELEERTRAYLRREPFVDSDALPVEGKIFWHSAVHWSGSWHGESNAARAALEQLYSAGELTIHHRDGARKSYGLAERYLPREILEAPDPLPDEKEHLAWRVERRVGAVGLLWNRASDAWLNIWGLKGPQREECFRLLLQRGRLTEVRVEGVREPLYCLRQDEPLLERAVSAEKFRPRAELLAPLDCMLWDRKLIRTLFDFDYTWEIYTPREKRKYGYYTLPLLYGERFIGRVEAVADREKGVLQARRIWMEEGVKVDERLRRVVEACFRRFAAFNGCAALETPDDWER